jgi:hypothetical protein
MIRDQDSPLQVHDPPQLGKLVDSADVTLEPEGADMPHVGSDFHPTQENHA